MIPKSMSKLRQLIDLHFDEAELRILCFDLGIEWEHLQGNTKSEKIMSLVSYQVRREDLATLINLLKNERPNLNWLDLQQPELKQIFLVGKRNVGKSSIIQALTNTSPSQAPNLLPAVFRDDNLLYVDIFLDIQTQDNQIWEAIKQAAVLVYVVDNIPQKSELKLFETVSNRTMRIPKIIFINKWDVAERVITKKDRDSMYATIVKELASFVLAPSHILHGNAILYNSKTDSIRPTQLIDLKKLIYSLV